MSDSDDELVDVEVHAVLGPAGFAVMLQSGGWQLVMSSGAAYGLAKLLVEAGDAVQRMAVSGEAAGLDGPRMFDGGDDD